MVYSVACAGKLVDDAHDEHSKASVRRRFGVVARTDSGGEVRAWLICCLLDLSGSKINYHTMHNETSEKGVG